MKKESYLMEDNIVEHMISMLMKEIVNPRRKLELMKMVIISGLYNEKNQELPGWEMRSKISHVSKMNLFERTCIVKRVKKNLKEKKSSWRRRIMVGLIKLFVWGCNG